MISASPLNILNCHSPSKSECEHMYLSKGSFGSQILEKFFKRGYYQSGDLDCKWPRFGWNVNANGLWNWEHTTCMVQVILEGIATQVLMKQWLEKSFHHFPELGSDRSAPNCKEIFTLVPAPANDFSKN